MKCMFCDYQIPQGTRYCPNCGAETGDGSLVKDSDVIAAPENLLGDDLSAAAGGGLAGGSSARLPNIPSSRGTNFLFPSTCKSDPEMLGRIRGWNWGAFLFSWIWAFGHNLVGIGMLTFFFATPPFGIIAMVLLGLYGNELAWKSKHYESIEQFRSQEAKWTTAAFVVFFAIIGLAFLLMLIALFD